MVRTDRARDQCADLGIARPDILEEYRLAVAAGAQRLSGKINIDRAGKGKGDNQRR